MSNKKLIRPKWVPAAYREVDEKEKSKPIVGQTQIRQIARADKQKPGFGKSKLHR